MSDMSSHRPPPKQPLSKSAQIGLWVGMAIGIAAFWIIGPRYFPPPREGGMNWLMVIWGTLIGGISAGLGAIVGVLIGRSLEQ
jgi:purine-cytosine permease-like protein